MFKNEISINIKKVKNSKSSRNASSRDGTARDNLGREIYNFANSQAK